MEIVPIFILIAIIAIAIGAAASSAKRTKSAGLSSAAYRQAHFPPSKIYQALETIEILEHTKNYDTFKSRMSFLSDLSKDIHVFRNSSKYNSFVNVALDQYKKAYQKNAISRWQREFIETPNISVNHDFTARLEARFFIDFCEAMQDEINRLKTEAAKQKRKNRVREVAVSIIEDHRTNNHIGLATLIADEALKLGVEIDKSSI